MSTTQTEPTRPSDIAGWGLCLAVVGLVVFGLIASFTSQPLWMVGSAVTGTIGGLLVLVGLIAWAVQLGSRAARH